MTATATSPTALDVVAHRLVTAVFQPIVDIDTGAVVGLEALARGPAGTALESPAALFADAELHGVGPQLDRICRSVAVEAVVDEGVPRDLPVFLNVEPSALTRTCTGWADEVVMDAARDRPFVLEITERELAADPAGLIAGLQDARRHGFGIAIDDLGAHRASLALLPLVAPDVIKLDMSLVHRPIDGEAVALAAAVCADAERRDAVVVAEGIEDDVHRERAIVLGASLAQGWRFGRPAPLSAGAVWSGRTSWPGEVHSVDDIAHTPWSLVDRHKVRRATKASLMPMSRHLEHRALGSPDNVVLTAFQQRHHVTPGTVERYRGLVDRCELVGAVAAGLDGTVLPGLRTADLHPEHPLCREWTVVVVGPHLAAALIAREVRTEVERDDERVFEYVLTHDHDTVNAAARSLTQHIIARR